MIGPAMFALSLLLATGTETSRGGARPPVVLELTGTTSNPRNSEGAIVTLRNGDILFVYTHFTGGAKDGDAAYLAGRISADGGKTWSPKDRVIVPPDPRAPNTMSVSLLRLEDGRIALAYLPKYGKDDCRPVIRFSSDEAASWSEPRAIIPESSNGYYVLNNDRLVQLKSGRLVAPVSRHCRTGEPWQNGGHILCYLSDDGGATWRASASELFSAATLQEPGVVELEGGRLLMFLRTAVGSQYLSESRDGGNTWTEPKASNIVSPQSPASIKRVPRSGELLLVWNRNYEAGKPSAGKRTPLCVALSSDEGQTWGQERIIEDDPNGWYCYTAIHFVGDHVLLAYCAGDRRRSNGLADTRVVRVPLAWVRGAAASTATAPDHE